VWGDGSSFCSGASTEVWFRWVRFPPEVIVLAVRCSLRYGLSYRDVEDLLTERGIEVDHVGVYLWVQRFTPLRIDAARPCRQPPVIGGSSMRLTSNSSDGGSTYRAIDQFGQVIDVLVAQKRNLAATRRFFTRALEAQPTPSRGEHRPGSCVPASAR
jgi:transposase, IS6 family